MVERAPKGLRLAMDRRRWAEERLSELEASRLEALQGALDRGGRREVRFQSGELRLYVNGAPILDKIYLDLDAGRLGPVGIQDSHPGLVVIQALDGPIRFE
jgi:hypothetical protein